MTSNEALDRIGEGKKVARRKWKWGTFIDKDCYDNIMLHSAWNSGLTTLFVLELEDVEATDWFVVEELHA